MLAVLEEQGSLRRAAQRLGLHENTVGKRIRNAEKLLGRPISERPVDLAVALVIQRTAG